MNTGYQLVFMFEKSIKEVEIINTNVNKRLEQVLTEMERNNQQVKRLRKVKKKLFSKTSSRTKEILLKYEELESIERTIATRTVYIQAINDTLNKMKWLLTKREK